MRHRLFIPAATALLFALAACTQDELAGDNRLPEGEYPVVIRATGLSVEATPLAAPSTRAAVDVFPHVPLHKIRSLKGSSLFPTPKSFLQPVCSNPWTCSCVAPSFPVSNGEVLHLRLFHFLPALPLPIASLPFCYHFFCHSGADLK